MDSAAVVNLGAFHDAIVAEARADAQRSRDAAEHDVRRWVADAQQEADRQLERARGEGRVAAELETRRRRSEARRHARERVLHTKRAALDDLRHRALELLRAQHDSGEYARMLDRLEQTSRSQLTGEVEVDRDPSGGGLAAHVDQRRVDYTLPVLVDAELSAMGARLQELWR